MKKLKIKKAPKKENKKEKRVLWKTILSIILALAITFISLFLVFALYIVITSPDFEQNELYQIEPSILYDKYGNEFARVGSEDSSIIAYEDIPNVLIDALVATEDARFFQHNGIDLFRFVVATFKTLLGSKDAGGASTLSMQVIKNTYTQKGELEKSKIESLVRKFRDIYMAVFKLESNYTKEEIIEFYLNSQWFANSATINTNGTYGIERAAQYYFGKSAKDLNLAEATMMVGMFQNPRFYNPYRNPEGCRNRQKVVLKLMVRHGYITEEEMNAVLDIPLSIMLIEKQKSNTQAESYQAFVDYVINEVEEDLGVNARRVSLKIYTTFDPKVQKVLEAVENGDTFEFPNDVIQEGIAVTSTTDGSVVALSGGRGYQALGLNHATDINYQPGSTAKPFFDYAMYIQNISQSTYDMFIDDETTYSNGTHISNYDNKYKGFITMRLALSDSRNIPALLAFKAVYKLDPNIIKDFVHSVGIDYGTDLFESASIGGFNGMSPLESSAAYATFARGGYYIEPYGYTKVINNATNVETNHSYTKTQVMEESTAYMITDILIDAYGGKSASGTRTAGKTGTTNLDGNTKAKYNLKGTGAVKDVWIVSYSPSYSISLWYGYDQIYNDAAEKHYYLTSATGSNARRRIMNALATGIHEKNQNFKKPNTVSEIRVEKETIPAQLCSEYTPKTKDNDMCLTEYFVKGTEPTEVSKRFAKLDNPTNGSYTFANNIITLTWDPISTPEAIDTNILSNFFNENFGVHAEKYYQKRLAYNNTYMGTLGYEIYLLDASGSEKYIGFTNNNSFIYNATTGGEYNFVIKSAYTIFKDNKSSGLTINTKTIDPSINTIIDTTTDTETNNNNNEET